MNCPSAYEMDPFEKKVLSRLFYELPQWVGNGSFYELPQWVGNGSFYELPQWVGNGSFYELPQWVGNGSSWEKSHFETFLFHTSMSMKWSL
jgi:hypothetical protein